MSNVKERCRSITNLHKLNLACDYEEALSIYIKDIFLVGKMQKEFLKSGCFLLYLFILDSCHKFMSVFKQNCEWDGIEVYGIKTDALLVKPISQQNLTLS